MNELDQLIKIHQSGENKIKEIFEHPDIKKHFETLSRVYMKKCKISLLEAESIVYDAFINTLRTYVIDKGSKFTSLWSRWMFPIITDFFNFNELNGIFKHDGTYRKYKKLREYKEENPTATQEDIERDLGFGERTYKNLINICDSYCINSVDKDQEGKLLDIPVEVDIFDCPIEKYDDIYYALEQLPREDDKYLLMMRFGLLNSEKKTLAEIAELSGCTSENIRLRQNKSLDKLKKIMETQYETK